MFDKHCFYHLPETVISVMHEKTTFLNFKSVKYLGAGSHCYSISGQLILLYKNVLKQWSCAFVLYNVSSKLFSYNMFRIFFFIIDQSDNTRWKERPSVWLPNRSNRSLDETTTCCNIFPKLCQFHFNQNSKFRTRHAMFSLQTEPSNNKNEDYFIADPFKMVFLVLLISVQKTSL